jgi:hypothetical protein
MIIILKFKDKKDGNIEVKLKEKDGIDRLNTNNIMCTSISNEKNKFKS